VSEEDGVTSPVFFTKNRILSEASSVISEKYDSEDPESTYIYEKNKAKRLMTQRHPHDGS
jgi:hypothetical protein